MDSRVSFYPRVPLNMLISIRCLLSQFNLPVSRQSYPHNAGKRLECHMCPLSKKVNINIMKGHYYEYLKTSLHRGNT